MNGWGDVPQVVVDETKVETVDSPGIGRSEDAAHDDALID